MSPEDLGERLAELWPAGGPFHALPRPFAIQTAVPLPPHPQYRSLPPGLTHSAAVTVRARDTHKDNNST